ncbi:magnesium and cobalt transport protein CorA [Demequina aestuarii]|uniref:magnesium and cobalt transport protein CorA n=1 Tax=Demequina aestuarii TaxID=327095 RepID=UPI000781AE16|nr:magnesium and cobalt transport protein CorA [Demequina aestuarii]
MSRVRDRASRLARRRRSAVPATADASHGSDVGLARFFADGHARSAPEGASPADAREFGASAPGQMALLLYPDPSASAIHDLAEAWDLHPILVEDLLHAGQRPKLERYGDVLFLVVRSAHYDDEREEVDLAEFHVLVRPGAAAVLCQDGVWIDGTTADALATASTADAERVLGSLLDGELLHLGPEAIAYRLLDAIVDGYAPVLHEVGIDKEQIERQVFSGDAAVAERIYRLTQEVIDVQHATSWLVEVLEGLRGGFRKHDVAEELQTYLQDVEDHLDRIGSQIAEYREALTQILSVNSTLVAERQNEDMKKISGWAAILFAPTLVAAIYGMNFQHMPELHWAFGYPLALGVMVGFSVVLYRVFKAKRWM